MYISFLSTALQREFVQDSSVVHPFYADSFSALYGIPKEKLMQNVHTIPTEDRDFLLSVLRKTVQKSKQIEQDINYFFDIRTTEEFQSPAPEYSLLSGIGLTTVVPLSIKGMGSLAIIQCFQLVSLYLAHSEVALVCAAELYHKYDEVMEQRKIQKGISFTISHEKGEMKLIDFGFSKTLKQVEKILCQNQIHTVFTEEMELSKMQIQNSNIIPVNSGLTEPFIYISEMTCSAFRIMTVLKYKDKYGFYIIEKE